MFLQGKNMEQVNQAFSFWIPNLYAILQIVLLFEVQNILY